MQRLISAAHAGLVATLTMDAEIESTRIHDAHVVTPRIVVPKCPIPGSMKEYGFSWFGFLTLLYLNPQSKWDLTCIGIGF